MPPVLLPRRRVPPASTPGPPGTARSLRWSRWSRRMVPCLWLPNRHTAVQAGHVRAAYSKSNNPGVRSAPLGAAAFTAAAPTVQAGAGAGNPALKGSFLRSIQRQKEVVPPSKRQRVLNAALAKQPAPEEKSGKAAENDQYLGFLDEVAHLGAFEG